jgi:membrane associated rhomboid family serine protease
MPASVSAPPQSSLEAPETVLLARYPELGGAFEESLVVLAMGLDCGIDPLPEGGFALVADAVHAPRILAELDCYREEQALPAPPPPPPDRKHGLGGGLTLLWVLALSWSFWMQGQQPGWTTAGMCSPQAIFGAGEWWRPFTALFLHADFGHLISNLGPGVLFGTWVCLSLGALRGWLLILLSGTMANFLNAAVHRGEGFASLGASTAVFGALGLLTGVALFESMRDRSRRGRFRYLVPLGGGLALFSLWGVGNDPRTDVSGHLCGLLCGFFLGVIAAWRETRAAARAAAGP